jgi:hypothetical protein
LNESGSENASSFKHSRYRNALVFLETDSFNQPVLGLPAWHSGVVPSWQDFIELNLHALLKVVTHLAACFIELLEMP